MGPGANAGGIQNQKYSKSTDINLVNAQATTSPKRLPVKGFLRQRRSDRSLIGLLLRSEEVELRAVLGPNPFSASPSGRPDDRNRAGEDYDREQPLRMACIDTARDGFDTPLASRTGPTVFDRGWRTSAE